MQITFDTNDTRADLLALQAFIAAKTGATPEMAEAPAEPELAEPAPTATPSLFDAPPAETEPTGEYPAESDHRGVAFNPEFCCKAKDPFYGSTNKRAGQWKKRPRVEEAAYDIWYASQHSEPVEPEDTSTPPQGVTEAAFTSTPAATVAPAPADGGALMHWVSTQQAAGHLDEAMIAKAWGDLGIALPDIFPANPHHADNVASLYNLLTQRMAG